MRPEFTVPQAGDCGRGWKEWNIGKSCALALLLFRKLADRCLDFKVEHSGHYWIFSVREYDMGRLMYEEGQAREELREKLRERRRNRRR